MVANPVGALLEGRYIGILFWAVIFGLAIKGIGADSTKRMMVDMADAIMAQRAYEANLALVNISRSMAAKAVEIGRG